MNDSPDSQPFQRAAFYVDGFNLFHSIDDLKRPYLKWLDLKALAQRLLIGKRQTLVRLVYCSAIRTDDVGKLTRHRSYLRALESTGVTVELGYFAKDDRKCKRCGHEWTKRTEKEGDVSLALAVLNDAHDDLYDVAYIVTADGDQAPTVRSIRTRFPQKKVYSVSPPGRSHNFKTLEVASGKATITADAIEACLFPRMVQDSSGHAVVRPPSYDPPPGWLSPGQRRAS